MEQDSAPSEHPGRNPRPRFDGPAAEAGQQEPALDRRDDGEEERDEDRRIGVLVHEVSGEQTQHRYARHGEQGTPIPPDQALNEADGEHEIRQREAEEEARAGLDAYPEGYDVEHDSQENHRAGMSQRRGLGHQPPQRDILHDILGHGCPGRTDEDTLLVNLSSSS